MIKARRRKLERAYLDGSGNFWYISRECPKRSALQSRTILALSNPAARVLRQSYVNAGCILGSHITVGRFCLLNRGASLGHHVELGEFVSIGPGATLAGHVTVESGATIATGAIVLPGLRIGKHAVIGAGSVVTRDVPERSLMLGSPARSVHRDLPSFLDAVE